MSRWKRRQRMMTIPRTGLSGNMVKPRRPVPRAAPTSSAMSPTGMRVGITKTSVFEDKFAGREIRAELLPSVYLSLTVSRGQSEGPLRMRYRLEDSGEVVKRLSSASVNTASVSHANDDYLDGAI